MADARLDQALATRGLARSRTAAARLIEQGAVLVDGAVAAKASQRIDAAARLEVVTPERYVSRAAHKLIGALDAFTDVDPAGRFALDVGASTGGFTQVLLERGAHRVVAIDVGHGQMDPLVSSDTRVVSIEGVNARDLTAAHLARLLPPDERDPRTIDLVVGDLSFISLRHVFEPLRATVHPDADVILLIKPQFEVGRTGVRGGIVVDPDRARDAVVDVVHAAHDAGLVLRDVIASPIEGTHGNRELIAHFESGAGDPTQWTSRIEELTRRGRA